ncbi:MAG TPA: hypothetical protein VE781_08020 [Kineosporiaceae bacterium]|jgi:hypothetical protein|nr:hypothetical protein [Kineosporiaceae bacterium]
MAQLRVILHLADSAGTRITINDRPLDDVVHEFTLALREQRPMDVGMNRPGYAHLVNPQQVAYIQTLEY